MLFLYSAHISLKQRLKALYNILLPRRTWSNHYQLNFLGSIQGVLPLAQDLRHSTFVSCPCVKLTVLPLYNCSKNKSCPEKIFVLE